MEEFYRICPEECIGKSSFRSGNKKTSWWSDEIKGAILEKRKLFLVWLQDKTGDKLLAYRAIKAKVKELVKSAKDQAWKKFGVDLEEAGQSRNKKFWSTRMNSRSGCVKESCGSVLE